MVNQDTLGTIIETLLQIGSRVIEVSKDCTVSNIWEQTDARTGDENDCAYRTVNSDIRVEQIIFKNREKISEAFATRKNNYSEHFTLIKNQTTAVGLRVLTCHPDKNFVLAVIEVLPNQANVSEVEAKWKMALDAAGDGMWDMNLETGQIYFSNKWHDIFGYSADDIKTVSQWFEHVYHEDVDQIIAIRKQHFSGASSSYVNEFRYICKDGTIKWVLARAVLVSKTEDGMPLRFIGSHTDISLIKKAEEKHIVTVKFMENLLHTIHDGILVVDENQHIIFHNQNFNRKYEDDKGDELVGKTIWQRLEFSKSHHPDPELFMERTREIVRNREKVLDEELVLKDGRVMKRDFLPIYVNNKFVGEIWQFRDITQQKNAERRFEQQRTFYEQILNNLDIDITVFDSEFRYIFLNKSAVVDDDLRKWAIGKKDEEYNVFRKRPPEIHQRRLKLLQQAVDERKMLEFEEVLYGINAKTPDHYLRRIYPVFTEEGKMQHIIGYGLKITELVEAREALKTSTETFTSVFENSGTGMAIVSLEGKFLNVNDKFTDITGYSKKELLQLSFQDITHPDDLEADLKLLNSALKKEITTYTMEKRYFTKDKNIVWILLNVSLVWKSNGMPNFLIAQIMDITKKKELETELDIQHKFYENVLNNIPADVAVFSPDHRYLFVNHNAFKKDELKNWMIGKTDKDYAAYSGRPDSFFLERIKLYERAENERKEVSMIEKLTSKTGVVSYHLRLLRPLFFDNGQLDMIVAYGIDITELILVQEALKTSMDTFANAFHNSGIGMALISPSGHWLDVNKILCHISGYTREELMEKSLTEITFPEDKFIEDSLTRKLFTKKDNTYTVEKRYITKQQKIITASQTVSLVWNGDGTPKFYIAQIIDITEKKELERTLQRKNVMLEATRDSLVNKVNQLEDLNRIIAHNLRGPANNIKMLAVSLNNRYKEGALTDDAVTNEIFSVAESMEFLLDSSESLLNNLETLLEITQIQLNQKIPHNDCNLDNIINDIVKQLQGIIFEKDAVIIRDFEVKVIHYPKIYLESIVYNLISNALKYSRKDIKPEIIVSTRKVNDRIQLVVKDNGLGIDMEKYGNKVFKLNQIFHIGFDSKGVGLYITKTQIESLGGTIDVKSKVNEGCEFTIVFGAA
jgi:PAS domain S-box-containing protein